MAVEFKVLPGLPGSGPYPEQFTTSGGTHREGLVVQVTPDDGEPWIGNFQPGHGGTSAIVLHPDERTILVLSAGLTYFVDPVSRPGDGPHDQARRRLIDSMVTRRS